jgi:molecular chaperone GrpE
VPDEARDGDLNEGPSSSGASPSEAFLQRARLAEDRLAEVLAAYRKLKTENEGYRDRITRNLERRFDQRRERLLLRFIEILDNLDRALDAAQSAYAGNPLIEGLILVRTQLLQTLQEEGLERIPVVGLPYDPVVSEAVETTPVEDPEQHHVVMKDLQRGYKLNGRVARASKVTVGEYTKVRPPEEAEPELAELTAIDDDAQPSELGEPVPTTEVLELDASLEDILALAESHEALFPAVFDQEKKSDE